MKLQINAIVTIHCYCNIKYPKHNEDNIKKNHHLKHIHIII